MEKKFKNCIKLSGLGMSPRPSYSHIDIVHRIERCLWEKLNKNKYEVWQEAPILKEGKKEVVPDVVVFQKKAGQIANYNIFPKVIIEVDIGKYVKKAINKTIHIMQNDIEIREGFIYDYENNVWYKIAGGICTINSYSDFLDVDMDSLI